MMLGKNVYVLRSVHGADKASRKLVGFRDEHRSYVVGFSTAEQRAQARRMFEDPPRCLPDIRPSRTRFENVTREFRRIAAVPEGILRSDMWMDSDCTTSFDRRGSIVCARPFTLVDEEMSTHDWYRTALEGLVGVALVYGVKDVSVDEVRFRSQILFGSEANVHFFVPPRV